MISINVSCRIVQLIAYIQLNRVPLENALITYRFIAAHRYQTISDPSYTSKVSIPYPYHNITILISKSYHHNIKLVTTISLTPLS